MNARRLSSALGTVFLVLVAAPGAARAAGGRPADTKVSEWVQAALRLDPGIDAAKVEASTLDGIVTLSGTVVDVGSRKLAVQEAGKIRGVLGVLDQIRVTPPWRPGTDIVQDVRHRIVNSPAVALRWLDVSAEGSVVTLRGKAESWAEAQEACRLAGEVRGVSEVACDLAIEWTGTRTDAEIQKDVEANLHLDVYLRELPISVKVENGVVALAGSVGSVFTRQRAVEKTLRVAQVREVKNGLKVEWWEDRGERTAAPHYTDAELRDHVKEEIQRDHRLDASGVQVTVQNGQAVLDGSIPHYYQKNLALEDARNVTGIGFVNDHLGVASSSRSDDAIAADVRQDVASDLVLFDQDVRVSVKEGVVTLDGSVASPYSKTQAEHVAGRPWGVKGVVNHLAVPVDEGLSDESISRRIHDRLERNWVTAAVAGQIQVEVKGRIATLTGECDTWRQKTEAREAALATPGVLHEYDQLRVRGFPYPWEQWDRTYFEPAIP